MIAAFLFFVSLVLHELGHALVARREGIAISGIDLWFFGGVAKMSRDTQSPGEEFRVAAAGPAVTLVIVGLCFGLGALVAERRRARRRAAGRRRGGLADVRAARLPRVDQRDAVRLQPHPRVPARRRPDRARRSSGRSPANRNTATRVAGRIGEGFAYLLIGARASSWRRAATLIDGIWLAVLGWFIAQSARAAVASTAFTERIDGITVADIMDAQPVSMPATTPLTQAQDEYFLRYRWDWFPVVDERRPLPRRRARDARRPGDRGGPAGARGRRARRGRRRRRLARAHPTARWRRCSATSSCARAARSWPSMPTASCAAS